MKSVALAVATLISLAATVNANATSFTMTTETGDSLGFIDSDTIVRTGEIGKVMTYTVEKVDLPLSGVIKANATAASYAATATEIWFECKTNHYSMVRLFLYDNHGQYAGTYDKPLLVDQPVPPQTGVDEQYKYVCNGAPLSNRINKFNDYETPLQTLIRSARATMNDPRYVP